MGPNFRARIWPFSICYSREKVEIIAKIDFSKKNLAQKLFMWITLDPMHFEAIDLFYRLSYKSQNWWSRFWDIPFCASTLFYKGKNNEGNLRRQVRIPLGEIFLCWCWGVGEAIGRLFWSFGQIRTLSSNNKSYFRKKNFFSKLIHKNSENCSLAAGVLGRLLEVVDRLLEVDFDHLGNI
jgi:hypothetical protein